MQIHTARTYLQNACNTIAIFYYKQTLFGELGNFQQHCKDNKTVPDHDLQQHLHPRREIRTAVKDIMKLTI